MRYLLVGFAAAVACFAWAALFWSHLGSGWDNHSQAPDREELRAALSELPTGVYLVPQFLGADGEQMSQAFAEGPRALVQVEQGPAGSSYFPLLFLKALGAMTLSVSLVVVAVLVLMSDLSRWGTGLAIWATGFGGSMLARWDVALWWYADAATLRTHLLYYATLWLIAGIIGGRFGRKGERSPFDG